MRLAKVDPIGSRDVAWLMAFTAASGMNGRYLIVQLSVGRQVVGYRLGPLVDEAVMVRSVGVDPRHQPEPIIPVLFDFPRVQLVTQNLDEFALV